ncbi:MAG: hypothetical protein M1298_05500 [Chloroflexi bacterium]|nr:hypothetical protein [Chloroflexota bacterium]
MRIRLRLSRTTAAVAAGMALLIAFAVAPLSLVAYGQTAGPLPLCAPGSTAPGCGSNTSGTPYQPMSCIGLGAFPFATAVQYQVSQGPLPPGVSNSQVTLPLPPQVLAAAGGDLENIVVFQQEANGAVVPLGITFNSAASTITLNAVPGATYIIAALAPTSLQTITGVVQSYQAASGQLVLQTAQGSLTVLVFGSRAISYTPGAHVTVDGVPSLARCPNVRQVLGVAIRPVKLVLPLALPHTGLGGTAAQ